MYCAGMGEIWKDIPGHEGRLQASDFGRVRSLRVLKARPRRNVGYLSVGLSGTSSGYVHDLVAKTFIGPKPPGFTVNHRDGNKVNNIPANLEYVTQGQNNEHALIIGLKKTKGNHRNRLGLKLVSYLVEMYFEEGRSVADCVRETGLHRNVIRSIVTRWRMREGVGKRNPYEHKLDYEKAEAIRLRYAKGDVTQGFIAKQFNIHPAHVSRIVSREIWGSP